MLLLLTQLVFASSTSLRVGVHRDAGALSMVTPQSGTCLVGEVRLDCLVDGPVRFRWEGDPRFELVGDTELQPGQEGIAWVLPRDADRTAERARLAPGVVTLDDMLALWIRTGENTPPIPSPGMFEDLWKLAGHPDRRIRRQVVEALWPWVRDTSNDPFLPEAPEIVPEGLLTRLSKDPDKGVRRRTAALLKDLYEGDLTPEGREVLLRLTRDPHPGVRRTALASMAHAPWRGMLTPREAWTWAVGRVPRPIPEGRRAAVTLATLHREVDPDEVDFVAALDVILAHHPEKGWRYWNAWRREIDFDSTRASRLFRDTVGLDAGLVKYWARTHPEELEAVLREWEPGPPHSERYRFARGFYDGVVAVSPPD